MAFELAKADGSPLYEAEQQILGFTHCEAGRLLGERWELPPDLIEVIAMHHAPQSAQNHPALVALVSIGDLLCRMSGLNHGYIETRQVNVLEEPGFSVLLRDCPALQTFDWARLTFELESYLEDVHALVRSIYRT